MARKCFYSFHFEKDNWRVSQVRYIGVVEGNQAAKDNDWEEIKKGGDKKIQEWIDAQMNGRACTVVLAGSNTADRKWINYEIKKSWDDGKGILVIYIHNLLDRDQKQSSKGKDPLDYVSIKVDKEDKRLSTIAKAYDPVGKTGKEVYADIEKNIESWIEEAIQIRKDFDKE